MSLKLYVVKIDDPDVSILDAVTILMFCRRLHINKNQGIKVLQGNTEVITFEVATDTEGKWK